MAGLVGSVAARLTWAFIDGLLQSGQHTKQSQKIVIQVSERCVVRDVDVMVEDLGSEHQPVTWSCPGRHNLVVS